METCVELINSVKDFKENVKPPFIIWSTAPFCTSINGIKHSKEFYLNPKMKMEAQIKVHEIFADKGAMLFPGPWPDFGPVLEANMFGCEIIWHENDSPYVKKLIYDFDDIDKLEFKKEDTLLEEMLNQYTYMWDNLDEKYIREYGYLDGVAFALGPLETATNIVGYTEFLMGLYDSPKQMHKLISKTTDCVLYSLKEQEKINGKLKRIFICDHMAHQVSRELYDEFCFPYYKKIYSEFPDALKMYHNEGNIMHVIDRIYEQGANLVHYSVDTVELKKVLDKKVVLMGNLDPLEIMFRQTPENVYKEAARCMDEGYEGGGFLLSTAGGMAPDTPIENIFTAIKAMNDFYDNLK
ncbi:uroporphyrinogen decarboxylase family protein [Vallitalea guaymasensis]|uniref:uroporphyrinogen decarboxylase family protein n=1 Tax=Vallitalea guaymasensis TaxID=1185412 RepID=UPI0023537C37|nr:uroporphyrinogen decarboxylase family protein [Vallitalea guaymasensis]